MSCPKHGLYYNKLHMSQENIVHKLLKKYPVISDQVSGQDIELVLRELSHVLERQVSGDVVELGCYIGTTSLFVRRLLDMYPDQSRMFHVYDSFEGLPPKHAADQSVAGDAFAAGELSVAKKQFLATFQKSQLRPPIVHKGWFEDLTSDDLPPQIAFAFLDGDFYSSILSSLKVVWPRMSQGGRLLIDDYQREALPGVERAVQEFFGKNPPATLRVAHNIAIIEA